MRRGKTTKEHHVDPSTRPDNGKKPLMQIGSLITSAGLVLGVIAAGVALALGSMPPEFASFAKAIGPWAAGGAGLAIGLGAIGKGLFEIGAGRYAAAAASTSPDAPAPVSVTVTQNPAGTTLPEGGSDAGNSVSGQILPSDYHLG